ncbi:hypothetical protein [uncultured Parolsenella sp.]|uniref:hypothetical protein n=1 Tax=uncultured Parolsenella sp. TaxID=2083008 RepID=UPI0025E05952|nr:hypothetical protein [uncultured Parolsenella sp.]
MSYGLAGSANTIYVDANTASSGFAIVAASSVLAFSAARNGLAPFRRHMTLRGEYRGFAMDERTKRKGVFVGACILGALVCLGLYAMNPRYEGERARQGAAAVKAVKERFGLESHWEFAPYNPFDDQNDLIGNLYIDEGGTTYPTRITQATWEDGDGKTHSSSETFVIEVLTNRGYIPISEFAEEHGGGRRY